MGEIHLVFDLKTIKEIALKHFSRIKTEKIGGISCPMFRTLRRNLCSSFRTVTVIAFKPNRLTRKIFR
jgi:hypothetical protein